MSFQYLPFYTGDYLRDTRHLTPAKHGVYFLFIMFCWDSKGPLPLDEQECAGISNCRSADEINAMRYVLEKFFVKMADGWYNLRIQKELEKAENLSKRLSNAGKKGYESRIKNIQARLMPGLSQADASASTIDHRPYTTPTPKLDHSNSKPLAPNGALSGKPDDVPKKSTKSGKHEVAKYIDDAQDVIDYLNRATDSTFRLKNPKGELTANGELVIQRLRDGYTRVQLNEVVLDRCQRWGKDDKMREYLRPATLFAKSNFEKYLGVL